MATQCTAFACELAKESGLLEACAVPAETVRSAREKGNLLNRTVDINSRRGEQFQRHANRKGRLATTQSQHGRCVQKEGYNFQLILQYNLKQLLVSWRLKNYNIF